MSEDTAPVELDLREHMKRTIQTAVYPFAGLGDIQGLMYVGLGLAGEAGEVANQIKKVARDDSGQVTPERRAKVTDEIGDVVWYVLRLCYELGLDPYDVLEHNRLKLVARAAEGTLTGDGVHRGSLVRQAAIEWEAEMAEAAGKEDVFGIPLEAYERLITMKRTYGPGGLTLTGLVVSCRAVRCAAWSIAAPASLPAAALQRQAMDHIMSEHTPWGRAGRE